MSNFNRRVSQYQENEGVNIGNDGLNDGVKKDNEGLNLLNKTHLRVYQAILNKPEIKSVELIEILNISESTVTRATRELKKLGFIKRMGSDKTGKWQILK